MSIQNCIIGAAGAGQRLGGVEPKAMARVAGKYQSTTAIDCGRTVGTFPLDDSTEALGVNTPHELALAGEVFSRRSFVESRAI